jgi:hypothetical protein
VASILELAGLPAAAEALAELDRCYRDIYRADAQRDVSVALQLARQLAEPVPYDLDQTDLPSYKRLDPRWQDWAAVRGPLRELAVALTEALTEDG